MSGNQNSSSTDISSAFASLSASRMGLWTTSRFGITLRGSNLLDTWVGGTSDAPAYGRRAGSLEFRLRF